MLSPAVSRWRRCVGPALFLGAAGLIFPGCLMRQNDSLEVGGVIPSPLLDKPDEIGRPSDAPSVVSLDRSNWGQAEYVLNSEMVAHRPTYARRNTRYQVSARASGEYPTLAEALTLPRGPSESEQIYDAVTWPLLIIPAAALIPFGVIFEPWIAVTHESPQWEYERHAQGEKPGDRTGYTGDPLVDRLGLPVVTDPVGPMGEPVPPAPVEPPVVTPPAEPTPESQPMMPILPPPSTEPAPAAPGGGR